MKLWTLLSKRFNLIRSTGIIYPLSYFFIIAVFSCTVTVEVPDSANTTQIVSPSNFKKLKFEGSTDDSGVEFDKSFCINKTRNQPLRWKVNFSSVYGNHSAIVKYEERSLFKNEEASEQKDDIKELIPTIVIDKSVISSPKLKHIPVTDVDSLCKREQLSSGSREVVESWLSTVSPDCNFKYEAGSWKCEIENVDAEIVLKELDDIRRLAIRRWNRHPYLLARKIAITNQLAAIVEKINSVKDEYLNPSMAKKVELETTFDIELGKYGKKVADIGTELKEKFSVFCNVLDNSDVKEIPIVMSKEWKDKLCNSTTDNKTRYELSSIGVSKAFSEIDFLKSLMERTSNLGLFSVRFPKSQVNTNYFTVSLQPEESVARTIAEQSMAIVGRGLSAENSDVCACWNPMFQDSKTFSIARSLDIVGQTQDVTCSLYQSGQEKDIDYSKDISSYLTDAVTSETEFLISNGSSKLLRLPPGSYRYTIKEFYHEDQEETADTKAVVGSITWSRRRPNVSVSEWKLSSLNQDDTSVTE